MFCGHVTNMKSPCIKSTHALTSLPPASMWSSLSASYTKIPALLTVLLLPSMLFGDAYGGVLVLVYSFFLCSNDLVFWYSSVLCKPMISQVGYI